MICNQNPLMLGSHNNSFVKYIVNGRPGYSSVMGADVLTPAQITAMSQSGLRQIMLDHQQAINFIDQQIALDLERMPPYRMDQTTMDDLLRRKVNLLANIAAIQAWLQLTPHQQATTNGESFIRRTTQQFVTSYNRSINYINGNDEEEWPDFIPDELKQKVAGLPLLAWIGIAGAALFIVPQLISQSSQPKK